MALAGIGTGLCTTPVLVAQPWPDACPHHQLASTCRSWRQRRCCISAAERRRRRDLRQSRRALRSQLSPAADIMSKMLTAAVCRYCCKSLRLYRRGRCLDFSERLSTIRSLRSGDAASRGTDTWGSAVQHSPRSPVAVEQPILQAGVGSAQLRQA